MSDEKMIAGVIPVDDEPPGEVVTGEQVNPEPVAESAPEKPTVRWFINEEGQVYDWAGSDAEQEETFPGDDHVAYATRDEAKAAADLLDQDALARGRLRGWLDDHPGEPDVDLTPEQDARVAALLQARLILSEKRAPNMFGGGTVETAPHVIDVITLADYIVTGEQPR